MVKRIGNTIKGGGYMNDENNIYVGGVNPQETLQQNQVPMNEPTKKLNKKIVLEIVIVVLIILVLGGGLYFFVFDKSNISTYSIGGHKITIANNPVSVETQFMNDLVLANYKGAYNLTSSKMQSNESLAAFITSTKELNVKQLIVSDVKEKTIKGVTVVGGQLNIQGHRLFYFSSRLIKENFIWKVDDLSVQ